jgi:hypothetical protein
MSQIGSPPNISNFAVEEFSQLLKNFTKREIPSFPDEDFVKPPKSLGPPRF